MSQPFSKSHGETMDQAEPEFQKLCVHGLLPLVRDHGSAAGLRFAEPGRDDLSLALRDPRALPDGEISIRVFRSPAALDGFRLAAAEFGGNAVSVVDGPRTRDYQLSIVVRHDRDRRAGYTLEECIQLLSEAGAGMGSGSPPLSGLAADLQRSWGRSIDLQRQQTAAQAFDALWAQELSLLASPIYTRFGSDRTIASPLRFEFGEGEISASWPGELCRVDGQVVIKVHPQRIGERDPDLVAEMCAAAAPFGYYFSRLGVATRTVPAFDGAENERLMSFVRAMTPMMKEIDRRQRGRGSLKHLTQDRDLLTMLSRIAQGCPVATGRGAPPAQLNPRSGIVQPITAHRIERAFKGGLIRPVWWTLSFEGRATMVAMRDVLYGLTETGRHIAAGQFEAASLSIGSDADATRFWSGYGVPESWKPRPDAEALKSEASADDLEATGRAVDQALSTTVIEAVPRHPRDLALAAAAVATGRAHIDGSAFILGQATEVVTETPRPLI